MSLQVGFRIDYQRLQSRFNLVGAHVREMVYEVLALVSTSPMEVRHLGMQQLLG
jgi:hypothetical protein